MTSHMLISVRWFDGYLETFTDVVDTRSGSDLLWIRLSDGKNRNIPLRHVRWFSIYPESHEHFISEGRK